MKQIKIRKHPETKLPAVECPTCEAIISPQKNPIMDGYDCPNCNHVFQQEEMFAYSAAVEEAAEEDEDSEYGY
jgi:DNA-directed RNA polymerase subunit M/transcription elongation factor TFIIS